MHSQSSALEQAVAHHGQGRLQEAERLYRSILQILPNHPDANPNLGILAVQSKQPAAALPYFKRKPKKERPWGSELPQHPLLFF